MTRQTSRDAVRIVEVAPRDGLQNTSNAVPTTTKLELIQRLHDCGLQTIEVTSLVSPRAIPQLADCRQVLQSETVQTLMRQSKVRTPVLLPNLKGLQIAVDYGVREVAVIVSASEGFSRANIKCSVQQGLDRARAVAEAAQRASLAVRGYVSCIFQDPYDGPTPPMSVLSCVQDLLAMGCYEVSLGDTLGVGVPSQVCDLLCYLRDAGVPLDKLAGHFHDTYGQAVANVWQAYQLGLRVFDSSVAGLGGCPFAPGAKGNVSTEDIAYMFERAGVPTNVNLTKLAENGRWISQQLGISSNSRAGMAMLAKPASKPPEQGRDSGTAISLPTKWQQIQRSNAGEGSELQVFVSGVNLKVVLNRPREGNPLTHAMLSQLTSLIRSLRTDKSITRLIITGNGKYFCTGMSLASDNTAVAQAEPPSSAARSQLASLRALFDAISSAPQVTIACINGPAFGGGVGLAFACDIRLAHAGATLTLSEVKLGLVPAVISPYVLREWGSAFAREAMLSARPIKCSELRDRGVIAKTVEKVAETEGMLAEYLDGLKVAAPGASSWCKELVQLSQCSEGAKKQAEGVEKMFDRMMMSNPERALGFKAFKSKKNMDWDSITARNHAREAKTVNASKL